MKKMQLIFLAIIFCGLVLKSNAQSITTKQEGTMIWPVVVVCEDEWDKLIGSFYFHMVEHWNPVTEEKEWFKFVFKSDDYTSVVTGEVTVRGSCASRGDYPACLDMIARGVIDVDALISATAPLAEGAQWFKRLYEKERGLMKVVLVP